MITGIHMDTTPIKVHTEKDGGVPNVEKLSTRIKMILKKKRLS